MCRRSQVYSGGSVLKPCDGLPMTLQQAFSDWAIEWLDGCDSTSDRLIEAARAGAPVGRVVATTDQRGGRGRRGATWLNPPGAGLALSVLWRSNRPVGELGVLPLAVGVALTEALESIGAQGLALKWPNDLMHDGAKLAGILVEGVGGAGRGEGHAVVIGIGINLVGSDALAQRLGRAVTDLTRAGVRCASGQLPQRVLDAVLASLGRWLSEFECGATASVISAWSARDLLAGHPVRVMDGQRAIVGMACGLASSGALCVRTDAGVCQVHAGEVTLGALAGAAP